MKPKIAVLIPCLNEELTIDQVVKDFREQLVVIVAGHPTK